MLASEERTATSAHAHTELLASARPALVQLHAAFGTEMPAFSCAHPGHSRLSQNTWNLYGCSVTGQILMDTATAMKSSGLFAAGYEYVNRRVLAWV